MLSKGSTPPRLCIMYYIMYYIKYVHHRYLDQVRKRVNPSFLSREIFSLCAVRKLALLAVWSNYPP